LFGEYLEQQFRTASIELQISQFIDENQVNAAVAVDQLGQLFVVGGFDEFVDQLAGQGLAAAVAGLGGQGAQGDQQMALAGAGSDGDRLQQLRCWQSPDPDMSKVTTRPAHTARPPTIPMPADDGDQHRVLVAADDSPLSGSPAIDAERIAKAANQFADTN
jgi:hypothetical protein